MFETEPISLGRQAYPYIPLRPVIREITTGRGTFKSVEEPSKATIELGKSEVIYTKQFSSYISSTIHVKDKDVEVQCGEETFKAHFIADELTSGEMLKSIQNWDEERINDWEKGCQKITAEKEIRRIRTGFFNLFGTKHVFVTLKKVKDQNNESDKFFQTDNYNNGNQEIVANEEIPMAEVIDDSNTTSESTTTGFDFILNGNKYKNAPILIVEGEILAYINELEELINQEGIVQILRKDLLGNIEKEGLGMFVELDKDSKELIFNLNGKDEVYFDEIFTPLVTNYLEQGKIVLIECDLETLAEDIPNIENRIAEGEIYDKIYSPISTLTGAKISVERREINPFTGEGTNYIVLGVKELSNND